MTKTNAGILGMIFLLGSVGCGANNNRTTQSGTTRDAAVVREENRAMSTENWREVENFLAQRGYNPGRVDGVEDDQTRQAILNFQRGNKLKATGVLDNQTLLQMNKQGAKFTGSFGRQLETPNKFSE